MSSGRPLSNALDRPRRGPETALSNALDKPVGTRQFALSNALDKPSGGAFSRPPRFGAPPDPRGQKSPLEGPVLPALRRFRVRANAEEVSMAPE